MVIKVDADARPDVAERYAAWGWPANAFLTPDAQPIVNLRGYRAPEAFAALLRELAGKLERGEPLALAEPEEVAPAIAGDQAQLLQALRARVDAAYDAARGGYGGPKKYPWAAPIEAAFLRAQLHGEREPLERALAALERYETLIDRAAGGMFQYSVFNGWDNPHYEKIDAVQAASLLAVHRGLSVHPTTRAGWATRARSNATCSAPCARPKACSTRTKTPTWATSASQSTCPVPATTR